MKHLCFCRHYSYSAFFLFCLFPQAAVSRKKPMLPGRAFQGTWKICLLSPTDPNITTYPQHSSHWTPPLRPACFWAHNSIRANPSNSEWKRFRTKKTFTGPVCASAEWTEAGKSCYMICRTRISISADVILTRTGPAIVGSIPISNSAPTNRMIQ